MAKSRRTAVTWDAVREIAATLPGAVETITWGKPTFKLHGKLVACIPSHRSAEPDSLVVRVDFERRAEMVAAAPEVYYVPEHYAGYAGVLVRMARIGKDELRDLMLMAYRFVETETRRAVKKR